MKNPLKGEAELRLEDGRSFTLVIDFDGLIEAEQTYGKPMVHLLGDAQQGFLGAQRAILYGGLRRHHPEVTLSEVGNILLAAKGNAVQAISTAIDLAMPKPQEGDNRGNAEGKPKRGRAGKRSGGSGAKPG